MAQRPVANALILELEPVVEANMDRHLSTEEIWFAHDYVPFDRGENFAFLGGRDWDPSSMTLPRAFTDACEILLLLKDDLASHHREHQARPTRDASRVEQLSDPAVRGQDGLCACGSHS